MCYHFQVQHLTLFSLELHVRTRRDVRPDPEFDPICAIFYYIQTDTPLPSGKNKVTGILCVDSESAKVCTPGRGKDVLFPLGVDFHCRVIFTYAYTHVEFTRVNKMEAELQSVELKSEVEQRFNFYVYVRPFIHCLYFICERKFYTRTHVKITRQWKIDKQQTKRNVGKFFERRRKTGISVTQLHLFCFLLEISACILGTWFQSYISWIIRSLQQFDYYSLHKRRYQGSLKRVLGSSAKRETREEGGQIPYISGLIFDASSLLASVNVVITQAKIELFAEDAEASPLY